MSKTSDDARERAEARFQKRQKADQSDKQAKAEHEAQARAVDLKTSRLKALRMAREAADKEAEAKNERPPTKKKRT
jgi:hypothetical protein